VVAFANRQRDPLVPRDWTNVVLALDFERGRDVGCHLAESLLWRAHIDRLPVLVQDQHDGLVQNVGHMLAKSLNFPPFSHITDQVSLLVRCLFFVVSFPCKSQIKIATARVAASPGFAPGPSGSESG